MPFQIIRSDITQVSADAIVNTANPKPVIGGGTDSAIYHAAGAELLLAERKKIGEIARGDAVSTPAFMLRAKYIIHTVGPVWIDGNSGEEDTLASCYAKSLTLADELGCESIAFPLIATGTYGFPKDKALEIAMAEIGKFLLTHEMQVTLVVFDPRSLQLSEALIGDIEQYIDDHSYGLLRAREYRENRRRERFDHDLKSMPSLRPKSEEAPKESPRISGFPFESKISRERRPDPNEEMVLYDIMPSSDDISFKTEDFCMAAAESPEADIDDFSVNEDTFQQRLFKLIDERHLDDVTVYKRANIDRKVFSKIRCNENYHPAKKTAIAFAIALELNESEMKDLLARAEFALAPWSKFDLIISYFVSHKIYDINEINMVLFKYDQPLLGY